MELPFQEIAGPVLPPHASLLVNQFPVDLQTARKLFELEPTTTTYVCCLDCFVLYPLSVVASKARNKTMAHAKATRMLDANGANSPNSKGSSKLPFHNDPPIEPTPHAKLPYLMVYTHRDMLDSPQCSSPLVHILGKHEDASQTFQPLQTYSHQSMKVWLSHLVSRPGIETLLDDIWEKVRQPQEDDYIMSDIWDATELRDFLGPDNKPFYDNPQNEGCYIFSLFVHWFNPLGNKQARKVVSLGVIFMVCLNLPLHI